MHFKRTGTGKSIVSGSFIEALKHIWIDMGVMNCVKDIGTGKSYQGGVSPAVFQQLGAWTKFDQGDFVGIDSSLTTSSGDSLEWVWN